MSILGPGKERECGLVEIGHALVKGSPGFRSLGKLLMSPRCLIRKGRIKDKLRQFLALDEE